jgi:hypothetical protein
VPIAEGQGGVERKSFDSKFRAVFAWEGWDLLAHLLLTKSDALSLCRCLLSRPGFRRFGWKSATHDVERRKPDVAQRLLQ